MDELAYYTISLSREAVSAEKIVQRQCFLCGRDPSTGKGEHVFPKWLQRKYNLWNERLTLLNKTQIKYKDLTIPCCIECNTEVLSKIENKVSSQLNVDKYVRDIDRLAIGRWLSKILLGILFKESSLVIDRSKPKLEKIFPPHLVEELFFAHLIIQSARKKTLFRCLHGDFPFSLYIYEICEDKNSGEFDLSTGIYGQSIAIRLGRTAAIFVSDGGLQMEIGPGGPFGLAGNEVHPIQFSELAARVHYKAFLRDATHFYINSETPEELIIHQAHVKSYSGQIPGTNETQIFRDWHDPQLFEYMKAYMGKAAETLLDEKTNTCLTTLVDESGSPVRIPGAP